MQRLQSISVYTTQIFTSLAAIARVDSVEIHQKNRLGKSYLLLPITHDTDKDHLECHNNNIFICKAALIHNIRNSIHLFGKDPLFPLPK